MITFIYIHTIRQAPPVTDHVAMASYIGLRPRSSRQSHIALKQFLILKFVVLLTIRIRLLIVKTS
jgi:hypothetical protein